MEDTEAKVNEYISHRMVREQEILGYFQEVKEASSMDVVKQIYKVAWKNKEKREKSLKESYVIRAWRKNWDKEEQSLILSL